MVMPLVLLATFCSSPWPFAVLGLVTLFGGLVELRALVPGSSGVNILGIGFFLGVVVLLASGRHLPAVTYLAITAFGIAGISSKIGLLTAWAWISGPLAALVALKWALPTSEFFEFKTPLLLVLLPIWAGDIAAIFVGMWIGKHQLAPAISPKKTWEGAIANVIFACLTAVALSAWLGYTVWTGIACGTAIGILGQAGDLFQSALKRRAGLKDSGTILPGHGGILDRIDSLLFSAPAVVVILALLN